MDNDLFVPINNNLTSSSSDSQTDSDEGVSRVRLGAHSVSGVGQVSAERIKQETLIQNVMTGKTTDDDAKYLLDVMKSKDAGLLQRIAKRVTSKKPIASNKRFWRNRKKVECSGFQNAIKYLSIENKIKLAELMEQEVFLDLINELTPRTVTQLLEYNKLSNEGKNHLHLFLSAVMKKSKNTKLSDLGRVPRIPLEKAKATVYSTQHDSAEQVYFHRNPNFISHLNIRLLSEFLAIGLEVAAVVLVEHQLLKDAEVEIEPFFKVPEGVELDHLPGVIKQLHLHPQSKLIATSVACVLAYSSHLIAYTMMPVFWATNRVTGMTKRAVSRVYYKSKQQSIEADISTRFKALTNLQRKKLTYFVKSLTESDTAVSHKERNEWCRKMFQETLSRNETETVARAFELMEEEQEPNFDATALAQAILNYIPEYCREMEEDKKSDQPLIGGWFTFVRNLLKREKIAYSITGITSIAASVALNLSVVVATVYFIFERNALGGIAVIDPPLNFTDVTENETDVSGTLKLVEFPVIGQLINTLLTITYAVFIPRLHKPIQAAFIWGREGIVSLGKSIYKRCCKVTSARTYVQLQEYPTFSVESDGDGQG